MEDPQGQAKPKQDTAELKTMSQKIVSDIVQNGSLEKVIEGTNKVTEATKKAGASTTSMIDVISRSEGVNADKERHRVKRVTKARASKKATRRRVTKERHKKKRKKIK